MKGKQAGFTLLEFIIVVGFIVMLQVWISPAYDAYVERAIASSK